MAKNWYNVSIRGQQINWATLTASAILFVGLEIWRRKYIEKRIKEQVRIDISKAIAQLPEVEEDDRTILEHIMDRI
tara:strand:+ start:190 stop:417 length:228 start_codon:yes stop_codon:yes gene_type:complete